LSLPEHYRRFFRLHLRFALVMIAVGLLTGILFQESGKKVHFTESVPVGAHLEYVLGLALVHGHTFLIGVLVPLALAWILHLGLSLGCPPVSPLALKATSAFYLPSATVVVTLMLLKGYHVVLGVRHGEGLALLSQSFLGSSALRGAVYGLSHTALAVGLGIFAVSVWRSLGREA
jgi:hypothetical protein